MIYLNGISEIDNEGIQLKFSYIGYLEQIIDVGDKTVIDVVLQIDTKDIEEIVVIGYGVQKKSLVTGAIAKVDAEVLTRTQNLRLEQAIQGKTSGVTVTQNSGQPGAGLSVRIRGAGSNSGAEPLYIVNGWGT